MWKGGYTMLSSPKDQGRPDQGYVSGVAPMEAEEHVDFGHVWHNTLTALDEDGLPPTQRAFLLEWSPR